MSPDLATGIPEIDRQHGELLVQIAELGDMHPSPRNLETRTHPLLIC